MAPDLTKRTKVGGPAISLVKPGPQRGRCVLRVEWPRSGGDVDAVAFVEPVEGRKRVLQPLDKYYGSLTGTPFVEHSGDARAGGFEEIRFWDDPSLYRRILLWVFKYPGENLGQTAAVATLTQADGSQIVVDIDAVPRKTKGLVVAQIISDGATMQVVPPTSDKIHFKTGFGRDSLHKQIDDAYAYGYSWKAGSKD